MRRDLPCVHRRCSVGLSFQKEERESSAKIEKLQTSRSDVVEKKLGGIPESPEDFLLHGKLRTFREIWYEESNGVGYLHFDFHNGAIHTEQCKRLKEAYLYGSLAEFVGKRAVEKAASWKSPTAGLSHCA